MADLCVICKQEIREPAPGADNDHHLVRSPILQKWCLGCWMFSVRLELFVIHSTGRSMWTGQTAAVIRGIIEDIESGKFSIGTLGDVGY